MILAWLCRGRRVHIGRHRIYHGRVGELLRSIGLALALMLDDILDFPWRTDR